MEKLSPYLLVGLGSALGGMGRFWVATAMAARFGEKFPWGTILVNVTGSLAIGVFAALAGPESKMPLHPRWSYLLVVGICGGYTTFSAFSVQTLYLMRAGQWADAGGNVLLSVSACLIAVWLGYLAGQAFSR